MERSAAKLGTGVFRLVLKICWSSCSICKMGRQSHSDSIRWPLSVRLCLVLVPLVLRLGLPLALSTLSQATTLIILEDKDGPWAC